MNGVLDGEVHILGLEHAETRYVQISTNRQLGIADHGGRHIRRRAIGSAASLDLG